METFIFWQSNGIRAKKHTHHIQNNIINNNNNINKKWLQFLSRAKRTMSNGKIYGCNSSLRVCLFVCIMFFLLLGCAWACMRVFVPKIRLFFCRTYSTLNVYTYEMYFNVLEFFPLHLMLTNFLFIFLLVSFFILFYFRWLCPTSHEKHHQREEIKKSFRWKCVQFTWYLQKKKKSKKKQGKKCRWLFVWFRIIHPSIYTIRVPYRTVLCIPLPLPPGYIHYILWKRPFAQHNYFLTTQIVIAASIFRERELKRYSIKTRGERRSNRNHERR